MKLLAKFFNKYMSAEKDVNYSPDFKMLNKKRNKSNSKRKRHVRPIQPKKEKKALDLKIISNNKNITFAEQNIRFFFNFNWDDDLYEKESIKIGKYINSTTYWYLINSSYFTEDNIGNNIKKITENYLNINSLNNIVSGNTNSINSIKSTDNNINKFEKNNLDNLKKKFIISDKALLGIICYLNYDKKGKNFPSVLDHEVISNCYQRIKNRLLYYINTINRMNKEKINKLVEKAKIIQEEYNNKNNINQIYENNISNNEELEENYLFPKNNKSLLIRKKYWEYLYREEKNRLIKRDSKKISSENKPEEDEEEEIYVSNVCNVCNEGDISRSENLYECCQCGIKVHSECYGISLSTNQKKWRCSKCKIMSYNEAINLECILCPIKGGAMKKVKLSKKGDTYKALMNFRKDGKSIFNNNKIIDDDDSIKNKHFDDPWIHLSCAYWNKDVKISMYDKKSSIKLEEKNIINRYKSFCFLCKSTNYGPTVKCENINCNVQCHPECARVNDFYFEVQSTDKFWKHCFYCHEHRPNRFFKHLNQIAKIYNSEIFSFSDNLSCVYQLYNQYKNKEYYPVKNSEKKGNEEDENDSDYIDKKRKRKKLKQKQKFFKKTIKPISIFQKKENNNLKKNLNQIKKSEMQKDIPNNENNIINNCLRNVNINDNIEEKLFNINEQNYRVITNNNVSATNLNNETNSIKSNISHNNSNSSENNKSSTKGETNSLLSEDPKELFIIHLVNHLITYFNKNRIFCKKGDGKYSFPEKDEIEEFLSENLNNFVFEDLKEGKYDIDNMEYKVNKLYENIFKDENDFNKYYQKRINNLNNFNNLNEEVQNIVIETKNKNIKKNKSKRRIYKSKSKM